MKSYLRYFIYFARCFILIQLFFPSDVYSIENELWVNLFANIESGIMHESYRNTLSSNKKGIGKFESINPETFLIDLNFLLNNKFNSIPFNMDFQVKLTQVFLGKKDRLFGAHIEFTKLFNENNNLSIPKTTISNGPLYIFAEKKEIGKFEIGYVESVPEHMMITTSRIGVGGYGVQGNFVNYIHLRDADTKAPGYIYDYYFWTKQSLFNEYLDFNSFMINYYSPKFHDISFGISYSPNIAKREYFVLNQNKDLINIIQSQDMLGFGGKYDINFDDLKITTSLVLERSNIKDRYGKSSSQSGAAFGIEFVSGKIGFVASLSIPKFSTTEDKYDAGYIATGLSYFGNNKKFGLSWFSSINKNHKFNALAADFESDIPTSYFTKKTKGREKKNIENSYINDCHYYFQIVGFKTEGVTVDAAKKVNYNLGYLIITGIKAYF